MVYIIPLDRCRFVQNTPMSVHLSNMFVKNFNATYIDTAFMSEDPEAAERCPICKKDLSTYSVEHRRKHISRCTRSKPSYVYSDRGAGRPPKKRKADNKG